MSNPMEGNMGTPKPKEDPKQKFKEVMERVKAEHPAKPANDDPFAEVNAIPEPTPAPEKRDLFKEVAPKLAKKIEDGHKPIDTSKHWWNK